MPDLETSPHERARHNLQTALDRKNEMLAKIDPLLRAGEAAALLGVSVPTFYRRVSDGTVTKPMKLGGTARWPQSEILEVIERAKAAREAA